MTASDSPPCGRSLFNKAMKHREDGEVRQPGRINRQFVACFSQNDTLLPQCKNWCFLSYQHAKHLKNVLYIYVWEIILYPCIKLLLWIKHFRQYKTQVFSYTWVCLKASRKEVYTLSLKISGSVHVLWVLLYSKDALFISLIYIIFILSGSLTEIVDLFYKRHLANEAAMQTHNTTYTTRI